MSEEAKSPLPPEVGLWGISYLAAICWLGAMERPPHLKAIAPPMVLDGPLGTIELGGAFRLESLTNWFIFQLISVPRIEPA
jgi:uncharacterized protein